MEYARFLTTHHIESYKIIDKAVRLIQQDLLKDRLKMILLFGSHVNGQVTCRSDVDIAAVFPHLSLREATLFRIRISGELPEKADIQVFNTLPEKIKREIVKNHKILYATEAFDNSSSFAENTANN